MNNRFYYFAICKNCKDVYKIRKDYLNQKKTQYCNKCRISIDAANMCKVRDKRYHEKSIISRKENLIPKESLYYGLYNLGYDDIEMGDILHVKRESICDWRFKKQLKSNYKCRDNIRNKDGRFKESCMSGECNPMWIKDRSSLKTPIMKRLRNSFQYNIWRDKIFKRDKYLCQVCHIKSNELNAHHIKSFSEYPNLRFNIDNGITLCINCHKFVHSINVMEFQ
jgi:5-methylcytosine-specific restriction endonuclease McrA